MKNQNKINKIIIGVLIVLVAYLGYSRYTEQKRVDYYICYYNVTSDNFNRTPEEAKEICQERID